MSLLTAYILRQPIDKMFSFDCFLALRDRLELCFGLNNPALKNTLWLCSDYWITGLLD